MSKHEELVDDLLGALRLGQLIEDVFGCERHDDDDLPCIYELDDVDEVKQALADRLAEKLETNVRGAFKEPT